MNLSRKEERNNDDERQRSMARAKKEEKEEGRKKRRPLRTNTLHRPQTKRSREMNWRKKNSDERSGREFVFVEEKNRTKR